MSSPLPVPRPVDAVVERLRAAILDGTYPVHGLLPGERPLAESLGVSRLTLRAGLARLEAEGLVKARQGEGVRVLDRHVHGTLAILRHVDLSDPDLARSVLELRRSVAADAVAYAAERATEQEVAELAALAAAQVAETDPERYHARDLAFARAVLRASRSFAASLVFNSLVPVYEAHPALARALVADRDLSLAGYALTVALIRARDPDAARTSVRQALEHLDRAALAALASRSSP